MKIGKSLPGVRRLLAAVMLLSTAGSASAAEHLCGNVNVTVVPAPVAGGSEKNRCGSAWTTCGSMQLTIKDQQLKAVRQFVAVQQLDGNYGPLVETNDCTLTFGTCAWDGPPKIVRSGDQTIVIQTLKSWVKPDQVGTWKRAQIEAYCE